MFSIRIVNSAKFLQMPIESQALYFHLGTRADDDGVVEAYPIMKILGTPPDALKVLLAKGLLLQLNEEQVCFISDWMEHNHIRPDRIRPSVHRTLLVSAGVNTVRPKPRMDVKDNSVRIGGRGTDRIGKVRLGKEIQDTYAHTGFESFWNSYPRKEGKKRSMGIWSRKKPPLSEILAFIEKAKATDRWKKNHGQFIPQPTTFLNGERWNDDLGGYNEHEVLAITKYS